MGRFHWGGVHMHIHEAVWTHGLGCVCIYICNCSWRNLPYLMQFKCFVLTLVVTLFFKEKLSTMLGTQWPQNWTRHFFFLWPTKQEWANQITDIWEACQRMFLIVIVMAVVLHVCGAAHCRFICDCLHLTHFKKFLPIWPWTSRSYVEQMSLTMLNPAVIQYVGWFHSQGPMLPVLILGFYCSIS